MKTTQKFLGPNETCAQRDILTDRSRLKGRLFTHIRCVSVHRVFEEGRSIPLEDESRGSLRSIVFVSLQGLFALFRRVFTVFDTVFRLLRDAGDCV